MNYRPDTVAVSPDKLNKMLARSGMTRKELSQILGKSDGYIYNMFCASHPRITYKIAENVADALKCPVEAITEDGAEIDTETLVRLSNGPLCFQKGGCFARDRNSRCSLLTDTYAGRRCPFQKERRNG